MGQTLGTDHRRREALTVDALAPEGAVMHARRLTTIVFAVALTTLIGAVVLAVWTRPGPDVLSAEARAAAHAECADRVAFGLSSDLPTCMSWATELRLDEQRKRHPVSPAMLVLAVATGLLAGMVVHLGSGRSAEASRARKSDPAYRGWTG
ncbi:MAG: hypothetical protein ABWY52_06740 [Candidatus Limnocylindrales bacterium]